MHSAACILSFPPSSTLAAFRSLLCRLFNSIVHNTSFASRYAQEDRLINRHTMTDGLDHVINGECGNGGPDQGLHFDARCVRHPTFAIDDGRTGPTVEPNVHIDLVNGKWMTQWNQVPRASFGSES